MEAVDLFPAAIMDNQEVSSRLQNPPAFFQSFFLAVKMGKSTKTEDMLNTL
ncbi:unnamed protein product, partial [marine sediment metagenome]